MKINWNNCPINSYSIKELIDNAEPEYLKKGQRAAKLKDPQILRAMANTLILRTKSSEFDINSTYWHQYLMFEDFVTIAKDRDIPLRDAVSYAIEDGDVKLFCDCPSYLYYGWKYIATQLGYSYGNYRENRRPTRNNTELRSVYCFTEDTPVWTERGLVPIQDVAIGDRVFTHKGRLCPVVAKSSHLADDVYRVKIGYEDFYVTSEHPWYTSDGWVPTSNLSPRTTKVVAPRLKSGDVSVLPSVAFMLGLYLSDGTLGYKVRKVPDQSKYPTYLGVTFDRLRIAFYYDHLQVYLDKFSELGLEVPEVSRKSAHGGEISFRNPDLIRSLLEYCTPTCKAISSTKTISSKIFEWDSASIKNFLIGYFWGDGTLVPGSGHPPHYCYATWYSTNRQMIDIISALLRTEFYHSGVYSYQRKPTFATDSNGNRVEIDEPKVMYSVRLTGDSVREFISWEPRLSDIKGVSSKSRLYSRQTTPKCPSGWLKPVSTIDRLAEPKQVYNIQVAGDESYLVGKVGYGVHNCKHLHHAFLWLLDHVDEVTEWFSIYYQREVATDTEQVDGVVSVSDVTVDDVVAETVETDSGPVTEVGTASAGMDTDTEPVDLETLDEPIPEPSDTDLAPDALETLDELDEWLEDYPEIDNLDEEET